MLDPDLLNILACPNCKEKLFYSVSENKLKCLHEGLSYSVEDNVPVLFRNNIKDSDKE